jgi:fimbrial chaperone protein
MMKWSTSFGKALRISLYTWTSVLFLIPFAFAGQFSVSPIRLDFDRHIKSGSITVLNQGTEPLDLQMRAMEWTQDAEGKDQYAETNDIIFFPRIMTLQGGESRILRMGIRLPATLKEKTYRLFLEEIPNLKKTEGTQVAIAVRFGVPIFVKPIEEKPRGEVEKIELSKGNLRIVIKNIGNVHFLIDKIYIRGKNASSQYVFSKELNGWYLLSEDSRLYTTSISQEDCMNIKQIDVEIKTDQLSLDKRFDVSKSMCVFSLETRVH